MADHLIPSRKAVALTCLALVALPGFTHAVLPDPTRPPASLTAGDSGSGEGGDAGLVLQSVMIPKKGRPLAVIGGRTVRLGEKYGASRLIRVHEDGVVLDGPSGVERLSLTPGVEKIRITTKNMTKAPSSGRTPGGSTP